MSAASAHPPSPRRLMHCLSAVVILIAAIGLDCYTAYRALHSPSVDVALPLTLLSTPDEIASISTPLGTFTTGNNPGDRSIVIAGDHAVRFAEFGPKGNRYESADVFQPGHQGDTLYLATRSNGAIEVIDQRTLRYFGDVYRRAN